MPSLKKQQRKLLSQEIASKMMEYLMGLTENNETALRNAAEKASEKLVKAYYKAIKKQHKAALKATAAEEAPAIAVVYEETSNLIAS